ncbi:MAG TPA: PAS domain-containing protein, partial [Chitinophagaceae bacterium]|nr:PAS domain-containing protein [Chitinophagaceae bacterium]
MTQTQAVPLPFLNNGSEISALIRSKDWSQHPLGSPDGWPAHLRMAVSLMLNSQFPMFVWWGPELYTLYNDAYRPIAGDKHPALLGQSGREGWAEIWPVLNPLVESVFRGNSTWSADQVLYMNRHGFVEETYFTFSYSPITDDSGSVIGLHCACIETTEKVLAVRKLEESERNLRNTILQSPVAMCILKGPSYKVEIANSRMYALWGRGADQLLHRPIFDGLPEARHQGLEELLERVYRNGETVTARERAVQLPREDSVETLYLNFVYEPFREGDGSVSGVLAVAFDVTEQVAARKKVEKSEQQVRAMVESAPFPIGVFVGRDMRITLANQSLMNAWGKGGDVIGKRYAEVLPELEGSGIYEQLDKVFTTGRPYRARNQRVELQVEGELRPFFFNYDFTPLFDTEGQVYGVMNTAADVTDLNEAKLKVEQSERNFRSMILQAPVAMCILLGPDHVVDIANELMIGLWGKPPEQVLNKPIFEGLPDAREQGLEALLAGVLQTGIPFTANERPVELVRNGQKETVYQNFVYEP